MSESLENFKNWQSLIKQKFTAQPIEGGPTTSIMQ